MLKVTDINSPKDKVLTFEHMDHASERQVLSVRIAWGVYTGQATRNSSSMVRKLGCLRVDPIK